MTEAGFVGLMSLRGIGALLWLLVALPISILGRVDAAHAQDHYDFTTGATFQSFQNGFMVWRADNGEIWVYIGSYMPSGIGELSSYQAAQYAHRPIQNVVPPPGLVTPSMGFNRVWSNFTGLRERLGWATTSESGYTMRLTSSNDHIDSFTLPNGQIVSGSGKWWTTTRYSGGYPTPLLDAQILSFVAAPNPVEVGNTLDIAWQIEGTRYALLIVWDGASDSVVKVWDYLPTAGQVALLVPATSTSELRLVLDAANLTTNYPVNMWERRATATVTVAVTGDPETITTQAAFQQYYQGFMIWRADTGMIYTFGLGLGIHPQSSYAGLPDSDCGAGPPSGFVCPINGFGRVWTNDFYTRRYMGWAIAPEQGYQATIVTSGNQLISITLPDGRRVFIEAGSSWRF